MTSAFTKSRRAWLTVRVASAVLFARPLAAQQPHDLAGAAGRVRAVVDSIASAARQRGVMAGMAVVAMRGRDTLIMRAYGSADVENSVPLTVDHVFQFASITKQFTAAAVLKLVQDGRVALDTPITRYLPNAPVRGQTVTVRQLLAHTSGFPDHAESPRLGSLKHLDLPPDSLLALVSATPFYFPPGDQMRYSNANFVILGQLIEKVSGKTYAAFVEEDVLRPAGAVRAHFCKPRTIVMQLARGYTASPAGIRPADFISLHLPYAAGGFCGTAKDLAAWNRTIHELRGGQVLSEQVYAEMTKPGTVHGGRRTRYGLGLALTDVAGRRALQHGGDIDGYTTFTAYLPDDSLNVTVLINTQGPTRPDAVAAAVVDAALGALPPAKAAAKPPRDLSIFAGTYGGGEAVVEVIAAGAGQALRLTRGPMQPQVLRYTGRSGGAWTFTDGRARYAFESPAVRGARSPAVWADMGVSLVRWERAR